MANWNTRLNEEFSQMMKGNGESITFTPEQIEESRKRYDNYEEVGKIESIVRQARALASNKPPVYLTF